ncbi:MAG: hypothetical protein HWE27_14515 [Gammaproteobacteria bacterium]|nr:hypothetical protein [Gammaproteobacteria bacterium]
MRVRDGELKKTWFRVDRIFHTNSGWFFITRENTQEGPYLSHNEAESELNVYLEQQGEGSTSQDISRR